MPKKMADSPLGWGDDSLTRHLDDFASNQLATFVHKPKQIKDLIKIDALFERFLMGAVNPRPFMPMSFFLRAHSACRAATGSVMAGQLYEAQALLRLCLELGAYGFYIGPDKRRWERWMCRNDSPVTKQAVRKEFTHAKVKIHIQAASSNLGNLYERLYDGLIDFGAHPNEQGFSLSSEIRRTDGSVHFDTIYLHGDGLPMELGIKTCAHVGIWVLHIAQILYPERFQVLSIKEELEELRKLY